MERLQKVIAQSGYCSRRKAEELIKQKKVYVNDELVTELGTKVSSKDNVVVENNEIAKEEKEYYLLNKPHGVITTTNDDKNRKTVIDLIKTKKRIYPVGRLDYDTTGVLILTNDGDLTNLITHPKNHIEKEYLARLDGIITGSEIKRLKLGIKIENQKVKAVRVKLKSVDKRHNSSLVEITIVDGKYHQVKIMFEQVGHKVKKLKRTRVAFLNLVDLKEGEYRTIKPKEVKKLYNEVINNQNKTNY